ncbi:lipopolysaccharide biosynthesis protein [Pseudoroseicyclus aestuarii]|uniref:PST family polysaccharide transporter n=1 Tax=Pseudoroseicyclus aestuarii TaxID=1795041 RepID=A0A318SN47_9RHOB|nr:lipopolysaccharide biosynthesis protein [Pseudoroseicyclus aestuarii]PYE82233.1 PST family polysaccharide transporter [Pseudoroseicyclus aestuarii]
MMSDPPARTDRAARNLRALDTSHLEGGLGGRTARGGIIGIIAKLAVTFIQITQAGIMARLLAPEDFGLIAMAAVVTGFVNIFTELGLTTATVQRKTIDQNLVSALFFINLGLGVVIMLVAWAAAPAAAWFYGDPRVLGIVLALSATIPLVALSAQHKALLDRRMRFRASRGNLVAGQAASLVVAVGLGLSTDIGYWALVAGLWAQYMTITVLAWIMTDWRPSRVTDWGGARAAVGFGANLTLFTFANWFNRNLDNALIGWRWGPGELGFYTRAYQLLMLPISLVSGPITIAVIPALSRLQDQPERWRARLLEAMSAVFFISYGLVTVMVATSDALIMLVYGPDWAKSAQIFFILLFAMYGATVANPTGWIYITRGQTRRMAQWGFIRLPISLVAFLIGLPYGAIGVATGFAVASLVSVLPCLLYATKGSPVSTRSILHIAAGPALVSLVAAMIARALGDPTSASNEIEALWRIVLGGGLSILLYGLGCVLILLVDSRQREFHQRSIGFIKTRLQRLQKR